MSKVSTSHMYGIFERRIRNLAQKRLEHGGNTVGLTRVASTETTAVHKCRSQLDELEGFKKARDIAAIRATAQTTGLDQLYDIASRFSTLTSARRSGQYKETYAQETSHMLEEIKSTLNVKSLSGYVFSGAAINQIPIDFNGMPPADIGAPNYSYYQGSENPFTMMVNLDGEEHDFDINARDPGVEKLVRALRVAATIDGAVPDSDPRLEGIYNLAHTQCTQKELPRLLESSSSEERYLEEMSLRHDNQDMELERVYALARQMDIASLTNNFHKEQQFRILMESAQKLAQRLLNDTNLYELINW